MKHLLTITLLIVFAQIGLSQESHWEEQILEKTKGLHVDQYYRETYDPGTWVAVVTVKKKMGIYRVQIETEIGLDDMDSTYVESVSPLIKPIYDDISSFELVDDNQISEIIEEDYYPAFQFAVVRKKKRFGVMYRVFSEIEETIYQDAQVFFDDISWDYSTGTQVPVSRKGKWGVYDWYNQEIILDCVYPSIEDFPQTESPQGLDPYTVEILTAFNKQKDKEKIDLINLDDGNGDGLFKARSQTTKKWGLYQYLGDEIVEAIPMEYDSLYHFPWNGNYTAVFNDGKVGFHLSYWSYDEDAKQTIPCIYEGYKRFVTEDQTPKLAVQKEGKWGWVDWLTGEEKSEFKYDTPEDLPYPYYKQEMWLDE